MSSGLTNNYGSFTVSYELNGQPYSTSVTNFKLNTNYYYNNSLVNFYVKDFPTDVATNYSTSLGFSDIKFPFIYENDNDTTIQEFGIYISIFSLLSNNNYIITGSPPSITFNTTDPSLVIPDDFYKNITVSLSYVYNNTYYKFSTDNQQISLPQTVTPIFYNGIYSYTYTLALQYISNSKSNTATFSSAAVEAGNTAATLTTSALTIVDPSKTTFNDDEVADIAYLVRQATSHGVSSVEYLGDAISKVMKASIN